MWIGNSSKKKYMLNIYKWKIRARKYAPHHQSLEKWKLTSQWDASANHSEWLKLKRMKMRSWGENVQQAELPSLRAGTHTGKAVLETILAVSRKAKHALRMHTTPRAYLQEKWKHLPTQKVTLEWSWQLYSS